jgi:hypothetical protein
MRRGAIASLIALPKRDTYAAPWLLPGDASTSDQRTPGAASVVRRKAALLAALLTNGLVLAVVAVVLVASVRGRPGNPTADQLQQPEWQDRGPLELSPERGRFALTFSLVEDHSFYFSIPLARLATPDLGYSHGHYVSLFSPGLSFIAIPGYLLGRTVGLAQVGTFAMISAFALANSVLVRGIARELGASPAASWIGALSFLFASPAFTYAVSLFEHHVSLFLLLLPLYLLLKFRGSLVLLVVWLLYGIAIVVDYPNAFLMAPVAVFAACRVFAIQRNGSTFRASVKLGAAATAATFILPICFLLWFNNASYGSPLQMSGTVAPVKAIDAAGQPTTPLDLGTSKPDAYLHPAEQSRSAVNFFNTRNLLNGFYIQLFSPDRGVLFFAPVMFLGLLGIWCMADRKRELSLIMAIVTINLTLYSLWDDPWGGWAFGARYLVPSYAMMGILIAVMLTRLPWNAFFMGIFSIVFMYSVFVNGLGALTSNANPPQVEVLALEQLSKHQEKYTWQRNWDAMQEEGTKSFLYQRISAGGRLPPAGYFVLLTSGLCVTTLLLIASLRWQRRAI